MDPFFWYLSLMILSAKKWAYVLKSTMTERHAIKAYRPHLKSNMEGVSSLNYEETSFLKRGPENPRSSTLSLQYLQA